MTPPLKSPPSVPPPPTGGGFSSEAATETSGGEFVFSNADVERPAFLEVFYATPGWGKTSLAAFAPNPAIVMAPSETGYLTLRAHGRVPKIPYTVAQDWSHLLTGLRTLLNKVQSGKPFDLLVLDSLGPFERMCQEHVCNTQFGGDWGDKGFMSYHKGYEMTATEWLKLLSLLGKFKTAGVIVVILSHAKVKNFKNPAGPDYDRWIADCHEKVFGVTTNEADLVLFGGYISEIQKDRDAGNRAKGSAEEAVRCVYTKWSHAIEAKNRYGLPYFLTIDGGPETMWNIIHSSITGEVTQ